MIWLSTGWDCTGCLSAEIGFEKRKFFRPFLGAMVLDYFGYTLPVLAAITVHCDNSVDHCWDDGYLYTAFYAISPVVGWGVAVSGFVANLSLYVSEVTVQARSFWALSQPFVLLTKSGKMYTESHDGFIHDEDMNVVEKGRYVRSWWNADAQRIISEIYLLQH